MKKYKIKEIYLSLQGEGERTGRVSVFCRFAGCNLWSGREEDRDSAVCSFCDTDFVGTDGNEGGVYSSDELASKVMEVWSENEGVPYVVLTGGEPLLQVDGDLIKEMKKLGLEIAVETNGTIIPPHGIDWLSVSPKANSKIIVNSGNEIKIVYPQIGINPLDFSDNIYEHYFVQPLYDENIDQNTIMAVTFCRNHPQWKLSVQTHKYLNIP